MKLTIAIPTFNGASRLASVVARLQAQRPSGEMGADGWEILVIDNRSSDNTAVVVKQLQANWSTGAWKHIPFRYCFEPQPGLAHARQRAIASANGDWVGFIDDDNWIEPGWVASALGFAAEHPELGAFGSQIKPIYEVEPPENFGQIEAFLAIRDHGDTLYPFNPDHLQLPPGAGLVVNRQRWLAAVPAKLKLVGRVGSCFISGEDSAALLYLHRAGHGIAYNPGMALHHAIPASRLERAYLLPLAYGIGMAMCQLRLINAQGPGYWTMSLRTFLGGLLRLLKQLWQDGRTLQTDFNAAFLFSFHLGWMLSPGLAVIPSVGPWLSYQHVCSVARRLGLPALLRIWPLKSRLSLSSTVQSAEAQPASASSCESL